MPSIRLSIHADRFPGLECGPQRGIGVGLQVGRDVVDAVPGDSREATWNAVIERKDDGDWRGPAVHGKRGERFLYLSWQETTPNGPSMFRRAKLRLDGVPAQVAEEAAASGELHARLGLTDARGGPLCASVLPPRIRWSAS
jgi:hypothetical protein